MSTTPTLPDLLTPVSASDYRAQFLSALAALGFPVSSWEPDGVANNLVEVISQMFAVQSEIAYPMAAGGFLDSAAALKTVDGSDDQTWLALLAWNVYGVLPLEPSVATGPVTIANTTSVPAIFGAGDLRLANAQGYTYTSTTAATVPAHGSAVAIVQADQPGSTGSALVGELQLVAPIAGIAASNTTELVAQDGESNASLAARCRERLATLSPNGAAGAYEYFLRAADDGSGSLGVTRVRVMPSAGTGEVECYVQNDAGNLTGASPQIPAALAYILANCVPDAVTATVLPAPVVPVVVTAQYTRRTSAAIPASAFEQALRTYYLSLPIGGLAGPGDPVTVLPLSGIVAALQAVPGVAGIKVLAPVADVPLLVGSVPYVAAYDAASSFAPV